VVLEKLGLPKKTVPNLANWNAFLVKLKNPSKTVEIGLVGKYVELKDAYKSISEALIHGGVANDAKVNVHWIQSEKITKANAQKHLANLDGILVAPGFGSRGISGKIEAVQFAREENIPFLGICLGMQCAVIEYARNVMGLEDAHSTEISEETPHPVISMMQEQKEISNMGGTMRLGAYACEIKKNTKAFEIYGKTKISERHRHRYEFNNKYLKQYNDAGMITSGMNLENGLVEIIELKNHPFFVAGQFHPELKSTVANPHPLFVKFVAAAADHKYGQKIKKNK
jgi:CTP synthase